MNYYWHKQSEKCPRCGRSDEATVHIGKSSAGWCFALHVYPEDDIRTIRDWAFLFSEAGSWIEDEDGEVIAANEMLDRIRRVGYQEPKDGWQRIVDATPGEGLWDYVVGGGDCW